SKMLALLWLFIISVSNYWQDLGANFLLASIKSVVHFQPPTVVTAEAVPASVVASSVRVKVMILPLIFEEPIIVQVIVALLLSVELAFIAEQLPVLLCKPIIVGLLVIVVPSDIA